MQRYISSVFRLCYPNQFIYMCIYLKPNEETNALERKATLNFGKTETSVQADTELWRAALLFLYPLKLFKQKVADFSIVLQGTIFARE